MILCGFKTPCENSLRVFRLVNIYISSTSDNRICIMRVPRFNWHCKQDKCFDVGSSVFSLADNASVKKVLFILPAHIFKYSKVNVFKCSAPNGQNNKFLSIGNNRISKLCTDVSTQFSSCTFSFNWRIIAFRIKNSIGLTTKCSAYLFTEIVFVFKIMLSK